MSSPRRRGPSFFNGRFSALFLFLAFLSSAGAQPLSALNRDLIAAAERGDAAAVKSLLARGAEVNAQDEKLDSAFLIAGARGRTKCSGSSFLRAPI